MGAWGEKPMENDEALEWLANQVESPLLACVERTFQRFLADPADEVSLIEAEAAAALLVDLTGDQTRMKYTDFRGGFLGYEARQRGLWTLAARAVEKILEDKEWLSGWNDPERKEAILKDLLADLKAAEAAYED